MNAGEKTFLILALLLLAFGVGARQLPMWNPPISIETKSSGIYALEPDAGSEVKGNEIPPVEEKSAKQKPSHSSKSLKSSKPISINHATVQQLQTLKGVGPALANKIVTYRNKHGPFKSSADFDKVPGIGEKKLHNLLPFLIFD